MKKLITLVLLLPVVASADPGRATTYLLNEPATLMNIGLLRLQLDLHKTEPGLGYKYAAATGSEPSDVYTGAWYNQETDGIIVEIGFYVPDRSRAKADAGCRYVLSHNSIERRILGAFPLWDADQPNFVSDSLQDQTLSDLLRRQTWINCSVQSGEEFEDLIEMQMNLVTERIEILEAADD